MRLGPHARVYAESWLWEKNPLPHWGIKPASAACQSDALPTEPHPLFSLMSSGFKETLRQLPIDHILNELGHGGSRDQKRGWDVQKRLQRVESLSSAPQPKLQDPVFDLLTLVTSTHEYSMAMVHCLHCLFVPVFFSTQHRWIIKHKCTCSFVHHYPHPWNIQAVAFLLFIYQFFVRKMLKQLFWRGVSCIWTKHWGLFSPLSIIICKSSSLVIDGVLW